MLKIFICLSMIIYIVSASSETTDSTNEIEHKPPINLDPALRRALLKAIEDLEKEPEDEEDTTPADSTTENNEINSDPNNDDSTENPVTDQVPSIQYHSFVVDGHKAFQNDSVAISAKIKKIEHSKKPQKENVNIKSLDPISDKDIESRASNNAFSQTRSIQQDLFTGNVVKSNQKQISKSENIVKATTTTTTTTTTTPKPKPSHNDDGENIEELENHDVQVFQAPLVAAFTVHQDAHGLPRSVVPIYKQAIRKPITPVSPVSKMNLNTAKSPQTQQKLVEQSLIQQQFPAIQQSQIQQQLYIQQQLEQKQRLLEEQLQKLQNQQRQHEELLRQQHLIQQQQFLYAQNEQRLQQERLLEEQNKVRQQQFIEQQKLQSQNLIQTNQLRQQFRHKNVQHPTSVTFQPSIALPPINSVTEQQPPQREAVDFLVHLRSGHQAPFPLQAAPPSPSLQLQLPNDKPFGNTFASKNNQGLGTVRVFRQDTSTGNFGINNNFQQFPRNNFQQNVNRNFPRFGHDNELRALLYQSGVSQGGRSQEDLSIISKVLALNHGIPSNFINRDFAIGETRNIETKLKPPVNKNS